MPIYLGGTELSSTFMLPDRINNLPSALPSSPADEQQYVLEWDDTNSVFIWNAAADAVTALNGLSDVTISSAATGDLLRYNGTAWVNTTLAAADIPNLSASKITSGTFADSMIPNLAASKITSGTFDIARIPLAGSSFAGAVSAGAGLSVAIGGIMNLQSASTDGETIGGVFVQPESDIDIDSNGNLTIGSLPASKLTGTVAAANLPVATATSLGAVIVEASSDIDVDADGKLTLGNLNASKITAGTLPGDVMITTDSLPTNLFDTHSTDSANLEALRQDADINFRNGDFYITTANQVYLYSGTDNTPGSSSLAATNFHLINASYTLAAATAGVLGGVRLFSDTVQSVVASTATSTPGRTYGIQLNSSNQAVVNVPWEDTKYTGTSNQITISGLNNAIALAADVSGLTSLSATTLNGALTGNVTGNVTGNLTGSVTGNVTGSVNGDVLNGNAVVLDASTGELTGNADTADAVNNENAADTDEPDTFKIWSGFQNEYDAIMTKDSGTLYLVKPNNP